MFELENRFLIRYNRSLDILLLVSSFIIAYFVKKNLLPGPWSGLSGDPNYYTVLITLVITCYLSFNFMGFYNSIRKKAHESTIGSLIKGISLGYGLMLFMLFIAKEQDVSRIMLALSFFLSLAFLYAHKTIMHLCLGTQGLQDVFQKKILIIGTKKKAIDAIRSIHKSSSYQIKILGCLDIDNKQLGDVITEDIKVIGTLDSYCQILTSQPVDEVVFAMPIDLISNVKEIINFGEKIGVNLRFLPDWQIQRMLYKPETASVRFDQSIGTPTLVLSSTPHKEGSLFLKSFLDYAVSSIMLFLLSPLLFIIGLGVKLTSNGPVFFSQTRSGLGGRQIKMLKFRTMVTNAEELRKSLNEQNEVDGPVFKMKKDPRITPFGKFLRKTSLDELPQLFNVIKGEMSLVGPRPPIPSEVEQYETWQRRRLSMKPGLTCIWQVSGRRNETDFKSWMKMDLDYIDKWSIWLDLKLLLLTVPAVIWGTGE